MNFSAWAIRHPIAPILAFLMLVGLGWHAFNTLPITRMPNVDVPYIAVTASQPGAAPAQIETQVTRLIEDQVAALPGVKHVTSTISDGLSTTMVEFTLNTRTQKALQDVKDAIDKVKPSLPAGMAAPIVTHLDVEGQAIMTFALSSPGMSIQDLSWFVDNTIDRALQGQPGIGRVDRFGGADREIRVELNPLKLDSYGITASQVNAQMLQVNTDLGSGRAKFGGGEQTIRTMGDAGAAARLANTTIALPNGRFVKLSDLGRVVDTYQELRSFSRYDGKQVVSFAVFRSKGASEVSVARVVDAALRKVEAAHPNVKIIPVDDSVHYTYGNYEAAISTLIEGSVLAVAVVFLFLLNIRATLISALALPLSAIPTFFVMQQLGFSLNLVSFLAITLATGILVDDAIVEIENIARHIRMGKTPYRAAMDAAAEIGLAVIATSTTIVAVFVPVSFMPGIAGQYFRQFGLTVAIAVIFSLLVARFITPMLAAYFMRAKDGQDHEYGSGPILRGYSWLAKWSMKLRYLTLILAFAILAVSGYFMAKIPGDFMPASDSSRFTLQVALPPGSTLDDTAAKLHKVELALRKIHGVRDVIILGGASPKGTLDVRLASVTVLLNPLDNTMGYALLKLGDQLPLIGHLLPRATTDKRTTPQSTIAAEAVGALAPIPDIRVTKLNNNNQQDLSYSVMSNNAQDLSKATSMILDALRKNPMFTSASVSGGLPRPEVRIVPRTAEAARLGVTTSAIADTVRVATMGATDTKLAKVSADSRQIPIRVEFADGVTKNINQLRALKIATNTGKLVPLSSVADVYMSQGPSSITRLDRERESTVGVSLPPGVALGTAKTQFARIIASVKLPPAVRVAESGLAQIQTEMIQNFKNAMLMGLFLVLTVLILLFGSVIQPFTILFSLPLATGGVAAALILTHQALSMPVLIGILMLMGIVTKNAILLVDFAIEMRKQGKDRLEAMIEAGRKRARPIVMTSIAMSAGMLPSALGVGEGGSFRAPMATAVIGGIIASTILSLVIVPAFYLIMDDFSWLLGKLFGWMIGKKEAEPEAASRAELARRVEALSTEQDALREKLRTLEDGTNKGSKLATAAE